MLKKGSRKSLYFLDSSVGSISLGVPNTERGHCGKTLAILGYASTQYTVDPSIKWLVIADDDTILRFVQY